MRAFNRQAMSLRRDRWLVPYADFLTLLFAVFAVMFTVEHSHKYTARQIFAAVLGQPVPAVAATPKTASSASIAAAGAAPISAQAAAPSPTASEKIVAALKAQFSEQIARGETDLHVSARGVVVSLRQTAFFRPGRAEPEPQCFETIQRLAEAISGMPNQIRLEGHTDDRPIRTSRYRDNWELSAARSIAILELLVDRYHIPRERLSVAGFGEVDPLAPNSDPESRARNRRVDVVILN
jgi:chemotaxis protein MotB